MARAARGKKHICGRCSEPFDSRHELNRHLQNHQDTEPAQHKCPVCRFFFDDLLALEQHRILNGHLEAAQFKCDRCTQTFDTQRGYTRHRAHGQPCCDANHSSDWKKTSRLGYVDPDKPKLVSREVQGLEYGGDSSGTPTEVSEHQEYCHCCNKTFASEFAYDRHILGCTALNVKLTPDSSPEVLHTTVQDQNLAPTPPIAQRHTVTLEVPAPRMPKSTTLADASYPMPLQTVTLNTRAPVLRQSLPTPTEPKYKPSVSSPAAPVQAPAPAPPPAPTTTSVGANTFVCNINGCTRSYTSEAGLGMHKTDAHGVGGRGLDLHGEDSWMLSQRERERLRAEGLLKVPTGPREGGGGRGGRPPPAPAVHHAPLSRVPIQRAPPAQGPYHQTSHHISVNGSSLLSTSQNIGGALEMEQAKVICGKTLRLLLQTDVFIHHDGKMSVGGIDWTRIGVERQPAVVGMFNDMCHLPRVLHSLEYVPAPKTFAAEYTAHYPVIEFENAPARNAAKPGSDIIAMSCSKITLRNGRHEVVKIAAVDVLTCRVLMSHLVCTDPNAEVANWHSSITGLSSFKDMEDARQAGYKVLKGWAAARSALFRFIDKETIIVGHNLRSELDALRIIHGRAVDIAKVVEKAAQGPLSKAQVSLDSWCRDVANVARLKTDPVFGRDCVMGAFAAREIGLWTIKNKEEFEQVAKRKTKEYQLVIRT